MNRKEKIDAAFRDFMSRAETPEHRMALENAILIVVGGSHGYGTDTPDSDVDIRGVFIAPVEYYLGTTGMKHVELARDVDPEVEKDKAEKDTLTELRQYCRLSSNANPSYLEMMFAAPENILHITKEGQKLIDARHLFLSKKCRYSYSGYATSQLKKMEVKYQRLQNPPEKPNPDDYMVDRYRNKTTGKIIPVGDYEKKMQRSEELSKTAGLSGNMFDRPENWEKISIVNKDVYGRLYREWKECEESRAKRNPDRKALEDLYGYDTKNASHLIRLLLQGRQILNTGTLNTFLGDDDRDFVMRARRGEYTYPELLQESAKLDSELFQSESLSTLPHSPDSKAIDKLIIDILMPRFINEYQATRG